MIEASSDGEELVSPAGIVEVSKVVGVKVETPEPVEVGSLQGG